MVLLKHRDRTHGQKEVMPWDPDELSIICLGGGGGEGKDLGKFPKAFSFAKDPQDPGGLAIVQPRLAGVPGGTL